MLTVGTGRHDWFDRAYISKDLWGFWNWLILLDIEEWGVYISYTLGAI